MAFVQNFPFFSIFLPILCGVGCLLLTARPARYLTCASLALTSLMSAAVLWYTLQTGESFPYMMGHYPAPFGNEIRAGALEALMALAFSCILLLSLLAGLDDLREEVPRNKLSLYYLMMNLLHASMLAALYTNDLFTAYVFVEITTISACALIMSKPGGKTLLATMTYLMMSLLGSALVLLSISLLYGITGHLLMPDLQRSVALLMQSGEYRVPLFVVIALMTVGLCIKSALFPFHSWLPDAHTNATTASSSVLSGLIIKSSLLLLVKIYYRVFGVAVVGQLSISRILFLLGAISIVAGSVQAMRQRNLKRMLSYASVAQVGYICLGIGLNNPAGYLAACFHLIAHAAAKAMLFASSGGLGRVSGHSKEIEDLRGAAWRNPVAGAAFICGSLSMVGFPPFSGFISKFLLVTAALDDPFTAVVVVVVIIASTILNAMYYIPVCACILSKKTGEASPTAAPEALRYRVSMGLFLLLSLGLGLCSQPVTRAIAAGLAVFG